MRSPAIANDLDMTPIDTPRVGGIGAGRQSVGLVELEEAIDLVDDEVGAGLLGERDERVERRPVGQHAGRVVRGVDDDEPGRRA